MRFGAYGVDEHIWNAAKAKAGGETMLLDRKERRAADAEREDSADLIVQTSGEEGEPCRS